MVDRMCDAAVRFATDIAISCRLLRVAMLRAAWGPKIGRWKKKRPGSPIVRSRPRRFWLRTRAKLRFPQFPKGTAVFVTRSLRTRPLSVHVMHCLAGQRIPVVTLPLPWPNGS